MLNNNKLNYFSLLQNEGDNFQILVKMPLLWHFYQTNSGLYCPLKQSGFSIKKQPPNVLGPMS